MYFVLIVKKFWLILAYYLFLILFSYSNWESVILACLELMKKKDKEEKICDYCSCKKKRVFSVYTKPRIAAKGAFAHLVAWIMKVDLLSYLFLLNTWSQITLYVYPTYVSDYYHSGQRSQSLWWIGRFKFASVSFFSVTDEYNLWATTSTRILNIELLKRSGLSFLYLMPSECRFHFIWSCSWTVKNHRSYKIFSINYKILLMQWHIFCVNIFTALQESIIIKKRDWLGGRKVRFNE